VGPDAGGGTGHPARDLLQEVGRFGRYLGVQDAVRFQRVPDTMLPRWRFGPGAHAWVHKEDPENAGEGNREGGNLQTGLSKEAQTP